MTLPVLAKSVPLGNWREIFPGVDDAIIGTAVEQLKRALEIDPDDDRAAVILQWAEEELQSRALAPAASADFYRNLCLD